ncbi:MAG TPA: D-alanine--D-alanine ligase [Candidatus Faeciplasma pullistercoris]|uniref:D-alanine--D-alanine ligase n=1 Tax=Candidatus Faeciplasma pullistercoris TaxID=2840800 RepID=A0A9D1KJ45_9FIRM|nr:D-alanine--D-alanine ligase [Candidatus Faeciplasma pullistercoris]
MKINLALMFGGKSVEHEISIISALQAAQNLDREKYNVIPIYITKSGEMYCGEHIGDIEAYKDIKGLLAKSYPVTMARHGGRVEILRLEHKLFKNPLVSYVDVAFPIVHGTNVEDGTAAGYLNLLGVPYVGCDILSAAIGMDKYAMKSVFKENGIPVLDCRIYHSDEFDDNSNLVILDIEKNFGYPVIVKPVNLGSSVGISVADSKSKLEDSLSDAFRYSKRVLVERAITNLTEINCSVLGDDRSAEASVCERPVSGDEILSYSDKYLDGSKSSKGMASTKRIIPADISAENTHYIQELAVKAFKTLGCNGVVRIDFMIDNDSNTIYLNEINTIPGSLSFYLWEPKGVPYKELLDRMIALALKRERERDSVTYAFDTNVLSGIHLGGVKGAKGTKA